MRCLRLLPLLLLVLTPTSLHAQIAGPAFVFIDGTVIDPDEVNENFATVYSLALNRTGGTMTGALTFSADNAHDIGASGTTRPRDLYLARNAIVGGTLTVTGAATFSGAVTVPALSIPETAIVDGAILARVAAAETISGAWTFTGLSTILSSAIPILAWNETDQAANEKLWAWVADAKVYTLNAYNDGFAGGTAVMAVTRGAGSAVSNVALFPPLYHADGTAGAPSVSFSNDTNTGVYLAGVDSLGLSTGGVARWIINSVGSLRPAVGATYTVGAAAFGVDSLYLDVTTTDANPQIRLDGDVDTGLGWDASGMFFVKDGARMFSVSNTGTTTISSFASLQVPSQNFAGLTGLANGFVYYCPDCTKATPCAGAGGGAFAKRIAGAWDCN